MPVSATESHPENTRDPKKPMTPQNLRPAVKNKTSGDFVRPLSEKALLSLPVCITTTFNSVARFTNTSIYIYLSFNLSSITIYP